MAEQVGQEIGRKISASELGYDKGTILELVIGNKDVEHFLFRVVGVATNTKQYRNPNPKDEGDEFGWGIIGQFEATTRDGETRDGSTLYLPRYVNDMVVAALESGSANVELALDVYAAFDKDAATSYIFNVRSLLPNAKEGVDRVKALLGDVKMPALPAPKK